MTRNLGARKKSALRWIALVALSALSALSAQACAAPGTGNKLQIP
jgi:hypothetical protein